MSKLENFVYDKITRSFGYVAEKNRRPDWLITESGKRLEIDIYIPNAAIAIEVQGEQHYSYVPFFHKTYQGFIEQKERDRLKRDLCRENGVHLLFVNDEDGVEFVIDFISTKLDKTGIKTDISKLNKYAYISKFVDDEAYGIFINKAKQIYIKNNSKGNKNKFKNPKSVAGSRFRSIVGYITNPKSVFLTKKIISSAKDLYWLTGAGFVTQTELETIFGRSLEKIYGSGVIPDFFWGEFSKIQDIGRNAVETDIINHNKNCVDMFMLGYGYHNWDDLGLYAYKK